MEVTGFLMSLEVRTLQKNERGKDGRTARNVIWKE